MRVPRMIRERRGRSFGECAPRRIRGHIGRDVGERIPRWIRAPPGRDVDEHAPQRIGKRLDDHDVGERAGELGRGRGSSPPGCSRCARAARSDSSSTALPPAHRAVPPTMARDTPSASSVMRAWSRERRLRFTSRGDRDREAPPPGCRTRAVDEGERGVEADLVDEIHGGVEVGVRLAGKPTMKSEDRPRSGRAARQPPNLPDVIRDGVVALHQPEDPVAAALHRKMQVAHQLRDLLVDVDEAAGELGRMRGRVPDPVDALYSSGVGDEQGQIAFAAVVHRPR